MATKKQLAAPAGASKSIALLDKELSSEVANIKNQIGQASGNKLKVEPTGDFIAPDGMNLGNEIQIVVLDFASSNKFYDSPYSPNNPAPPACYAIGKDINSMAPENDSPSVQHDNCRTCPLNQFGSGNNGKSKACKNERLLAVLLVDPENPEAHNDPEAPIYTMAIPPTSLRAFDGFVSHIARSLNSVPVKAMVTVTARNAGTYALLNFVDPVPNPDYAAHAARRAECQDMLFRKPDFAAYEAKAAAAVPARRGAAQPRRAAAGARR